MLVAFAIGKWTQQTCSEVLCDFCSKVIASQHGEKLEVFTDGNDDYVYMLPHYFDVENLNYGQLVKLRDENGRLIGKERRIIFGEVDVDDIERRLTLRILMGFSAKG